MNRRFSLMALIRPGQVAAGALAGAAATVLLGADPLAAQTAPRELTIVAPAAPGGGWDQTARVMQQVLRATGLAKSVQVVNASGAAGTIGLARFVNSDAGNPNTLLVMGLVMVSGIATNASPVTLADVTPIARLSGEYEVIVVPAASPFQTLSELIDAFRENPRSVSWGGGSAGGTDEVLVRLIADAIGTPRDGVNYIAYSGGGQALAAVLGGHVTAGVSGLGEFGSQIEAGELRALGISSGERLTGSVIPTLVEQGIDVTLLNWRGVVAPPGISRAERRDLEALITAMAASAQWKDAVDRNGWTDITLTGESFDRFIDEETRRVAPLVVASGGGGAADGFGFFVLGGLALFGLTVGAGRLRSRQAGIPRANLRALATIAVALVLEVVLIRPAGFVISAAILFVLVAHAFGSRRIVRDVLVGAALSALIFLLFSRGLGVVLPPGPFG